MSDKYSIGTGSIGGDDFNSSDNNSGSQKNQNPATPQPVGGLFDGINDSPTPQPQQSNSQNQNAQNTKRQGYTDQGTPHVSTADNGVPDFLVGDLNKPDFLTPAKNSNDNNSQTSQQPSNDDFEFTLGNPQAEVKENSSDQNQTNYDYGSNTLDTQNQPQQVQETSSQHTDDFNFEPQSNQSFGNFALDSSSNQNQSASNQGYNSYNYQIPTQNMNPNQNYTYDNPSSFSSGGSSVMSKVLFALFVVVVSAFVILGVYINNYLPVYEEIQNIDQKVRNVDSFEKDLVVYFDEIELLYQDIESQAYPDKSISVLADDDTYWHEIKNQTEKIIGLYEDTEESYTSILEENPNHAEDINEMIGLIEDVQIYVEVHNQLAESYIEVDKSIADVFMKLRFGENVTDEDYDNLIRIIEVERDNINNYLDYDVVLDAVFIDEYSDNLSRQVELINQLKELDSDNIKAWFNNEDRLNVERRFYGLVIDKKENIEIYISNLKESINSEKEEQDIPPLVERIFQEADNLNVQF